MLGFSPEELYRRSQSITWWHSIPLGQGFTTQGKKPNIKEQTIWRFNYDFNGKTVLDIGCNDGGFMVAALESGARRVVGIDAVRTHGMAFLQDHQIYPVEFAPLNIFSEEFLELPTFDFTILAGVIYHTKNPLSALVRLRHVTREAALIESHIDERISDVPCMCFYEDDQLDNNLTNWWGPNRKCLEGMLRTAGFGAIEVIDVQVDAKTKHGRMACLASPIVSADRFPIRQIQTG